MKMLCVFVLLAIAYYGCGKTADDTRLATPLAQENLQVTVQWPEGKTAIEIPFELADDVPVVRCQLNGESAALYVDTASQGICLYDDRLARFGLKITSETDDPRYTAGGRVESTEYCGEFTLALEDSLSLTISGAPCLPGQGRHPSHDIDGILGVKLMRAMNAVIDFGANKIIFTVNSAPEKSDSTNVSQPIRSETN